MRAGAPGAPVTATTSETPTGTASTSVAGASPTRSRTRTSSAGDVRSKPTATRGTAGVAHGRLHASPSS
jgi:hypothetical protein